MLRSHWPVHPLQAIGVTIAACLFVAVAPVAAQPPPAGPAPAAQEPAADPAAAAPDAEDRPRHAAAPLTIDLKPTALMQGHDLRATVKVTPDSNNRLLAVMIDAPHFYASTERELMGAAAPRSYMFRWEKLPAGTYTVVAVVTDASGRLTRVQRDFLVYGGTLDGEMAPTTPTPGRRGRRGRQ